MKKGTLLALAVSGISCFLLIGLALYLFLSARDTSGPTYADSVTDYRIPYQTGTAPSPASFGIAAYEEKNSRRIIWVGDSRTCGMHDAMLDDCIYIAAPGEGYDWFTDIGEADMRKAIREHPSLPVVFNLGVNDFYNLNFYLARYRDLLAEFPDTDFYYLSVNPLDPEAEFYVTNDDIFDFNQKLQKCFPDRYLDTCTWMVELGCPTVDGIHYSSELYCEIHRRVSDLIFGEE